MAKVVDGMGDGWAGYNVELGSSFFIVTTPRQDRAGCQLGNVINYTKVQIMLNGVVCLGRKGRGTSLNCHHANLLFQKELSR